VIEVRWHGRGGQGAFTAARLLGAAALCDRKFALAFPSFGPERRGAPILAFTRIDGRRIVDRSALRSCDFAVVLDETLMGPHAADGIRQGRRVAGQLRSSPSGVGKPRCARSDSGCGCGRARDPGPGHCQHRHDWGIAGSLGHCVSGGWSARCPVRDAAGAGRKEWGGLAAGVTT